MNKFFGAILSAGIFCSASSVATATNNEQLRERISTLAKESGGKLGVAVINLDTGDTLTYNGNDLFPMAQLGNLPIALLTLNIVDKQGGSLSYKVPVKAGELTENSFCPLRNKYSDQENTEISLNDLIAYMIGFDDENAADILTRQIGGVHNINQFLSEQNIKGMKMSATQKEQNLNYQRYYDNYTTPYAMVQLLRAYNSGKILNGNAKGYMNKLLQQVPAGSERMRAGLPESTVLLHKTGSSATNSKGMYAATNDAGIFTLPDGNRIGLVVLLKDSKHKDAEREKIIADVTKAVYSDFK
ncbi:MAG: class A beta-lactamase [Bacteroidales bacterium]